MIRGTKIPRPGRVALLSVLLLGLVFALYACGGSTSSTPGAQTTAEGASQTTVPGGRAAGTPGAAVTPGAIIRTLPGDQGKASITPKEAVVGPYLLRLSLGPVQHMYDGNSVNSQTDSDSQHQAAKQKAAKGLAVLSGMADVANNIDAAQAPQADPSGGAVVRQVFVQVINKQTGEFIPYLSVTMDGLRDGRPAFASQVLLPMVEGGKGLSTLSYSNAVSFPRRGTYQVFVRVDVNPFFEGQDLPYAQFNVQLK